MKKFLLPAVIAIAASVSQASAADLGKMVTKAAPPPAPAPTWDVAFGASVMSDYNFRGVSQSNKGASASAYFEPQFFTPVGTFYVGVAGYAIDWPSSPAYGFTNPSAEIDFYGGWRNTWGAFSLDLGFLYYYYPKEIWNGFTDNSDFWEVYAKLAYAITPDLVVGANAFYSPDVLNYSETFNTLANLGLGIPGDAAGLYASGTLKWVTPWKWGDLGSFISGELGHWWIEKDAFIAAGYVNPSYTYYNAGLAFTYKALTLDLRYHGTDQDDADCAAFLLSAVGNPSNDWCGDTFIVSFKGDTTLNALK
jgi:uncharacterized protein (TIGR02001 family)